jgi:hypothetical protein
MEENVYVNSKCYACAFRIEKRILKGMFMKRYIYRFSMEKQIEENIYVNVSHQSLE